MKTNLIIRTNKRFSGLPLKITLCSIVALSRAADTRQQIATSPATVVEPVSEQTKTNEFEVFAPVGTILPSAYQPFKWGAFDVRPHAAYQLIYATGILSSPGQQADTVSQEISPGFLMDLGTHWALDYTPTLIFYSNPAFRNEFNNSISLTGRTVYQDWAFGLSERFVSSDAPNIETGTQTQLETSSTALTASYDFNNKFSLDMGLHQKLQFVENLQNSRDWSTMEWLNYKFYQRLNVGIGAGGGYVSVDYGSDQTYEQISGRVNWRATDKISFQVSAGLEDRQFINGGVDDLISPTFSASVQYQPFDVTRISMGANRGVTPSVYQNQDTENTSVNLNLNQRLLGKLYLGLNAGYNIAKYEATASTISVNREDDYFVFSARLSRAVFKRGTVSVFYQYSDNSSTAAGFTYSSSQIGLNVSYSF